MEQEYKQVKANQKGYWKDRLINEDEIFSVPVDEEALWFDDVEPVEKPKTARIASSSKTAE